MAKYKWALDPLHSELQFKVKHLAITSITGSFHHYTTEVETEEEDFKNASVHFTAQVDSISTNNAQRDEHLRSPDFFDVNKFPEINFTATKVESVDNDGSYELYGDLTIHGVTKPVKLDVEFGGVIKDLYGQTKAGFTIHGKINRKDYGLTYNALTEAGGLVISDEVKLAAEVQLVKQPA
ncbi:Polyisoprenoid-binding protein YceI [Chitinophaga costaii]|uniref:Polyisoprenoid-binding protein YceI n=1 Tax=Chitinophaga costaii TaxID=1335309 RepID=A0A1C4FCF3_9BACT|nr:YceI family protein [Chitinophaga costaii]PUZ20691.1 polyisoprenoid-binding protein [Chitinophaga costaii]SCC53556.1 Polyisoprenoid-binding protein YceI [Chitinophaga costaii]